MSVTPVEPSVAISDRGRKHGVSLIGNPSVAPVRVSSRATRSRNCASVQRSLKAPRRAGITYSIRNCPYDMIWRPSTQMSKRVATTSMCVDEDHLAPVWAP